MISIKINKNVNDIVMNKAIVLGVAKKEVKRNNSIIGFNPPINRIKTSILEPHDQSGQGPVSRQADDKIVFTMSYLFLIFHLILAY